MAHYSVGFGNNARINTGAVPLAEFVALATQRPRVVELGVSNDASLAGGQYGFGKPAAGGSGYTTSYTPLPEDPTSPSTTAAVITEWTGRPTSPANFFRRVVTANGAGAGFVWTFQFGIPIAPSSSLVLWSIGDARFTLEMYVVISE